MWFGTLDAPCPINLAKPPELPSAMSEVGFTPLSSLESDVSGASAGTPAPIFSNADELKQLLTEILQALVSLASQKDTLRAISPSAAIAVDGAIVNVKDVADRLKGDQPEEAAVHQSRLAEASTFLKGVLSAGASVAMSATELGGAIRPLLERLGPLVEKMNVAAAGIARLWTGA